jgi:hypothetical protein
MVYLSNQSINLASRPLDPFACERLQGIQQSVNAVQHVVPCVVLNNTAVTTHTHVRQTVERFRYYATATQYKHICFVNAERENMPNARYAHEPLAGAAATRMRNRGATRSSDIRKQRKTSMSSRARRAYRQVLLGSSRSYRQFVTRLIFSTIRQRAPAAPAYSQGRTRRSFCQGGRTHRNLRCRAHWRRPLTDRDASSRRRRPRGVL